MFDDYTVTLQTSSTVKVRGATKVTWTDEEDVTCDVQDINKEEVRREWGITDATEFKQVFDGTLNPNWEKGNQVKYDGSQWWVKLVDGNMGNLGVTNHIFIILGKVI